MDWGRVEWIGVDWGRVEWIGLEWSRVEWIGVEWSRVEWIGVDLGRVEWIGVEWSVISSFILLMCGFYFNMPLGSDCAVAIPTPGSCGLVRPD